MMCLKASIIAVILLASCNSVCFALTMASPNYVFATPAIVTSCGSGASANYLLREVRVGNVFGGIARSPNYTLDATTIKISTSVGSLSAPVVDPVASPTNNRQLAISGTKMANTAVYVNAQLAVPLSSATSWNYVVTLAEGANSLLVTVRNQEGQESPPSLVQVTLDTIAPAQPSLNPVVSPINQNTQALSGTKEANTSLWINGAQIVALNSATTWAANVSLNEGTNAFSIVAKDAAQNASSPITASIVLDTSPPVIPVVTDDGVYTTSKTQLHARWSSSDLQTGITEYRYAIGTTAGGTDIVGWASAGINSEVTCMQLSLLQARTYYFSVKAKNGVGAWSVVGSSDGITVNQNVPVISGLQPPDKSRGYRQSTLAIAITASDADGDSLAYRYLLDGSVLQSWQASPNYNWSTGAVSQGIHTITVEASDNLGGIASRTIELYLLRKPLSPPV